MDNNVTLEQWDVPNYEYKVYSVNHNGYHVAKLIVDNRPSHISVLSFHDRKEYNANMLLDVLEVLKYEFKDLEFRIG